MGFYVRRPRIIPGPVGYRSSGRKSGCGGCLSWFLALALLGGAFGVSPVLGWLLLALAAVSIVTYAVVQVWVAVMHGKPGKAATESETAEWRAEHVPASAEYRKAHPEGPRDWTPAS